MNQLNKKQIKELLPHREPMLLIDELRDIKNINRLNQDIGGIDKNIQNFKQRTNEKINSVDSYTFNELEQFFANRYD